MKFIKKIKEFKIKRCSKCKHNFICGKINCCIKTGLLEPLKIICFKYKKGE